MLPAPDHVGLVIVTGRQWVFLIVFVIELLIHPHIVGSTRASTGRQFLGVWINAVNEHGGFGVWASDVVSQPKQVLGVLRKHLPIARP